METTQRKKGVSGSTLKIIAITAMLIDHIGAGLLGRLLWANGYGVLMTTTDIQAIMSWLQENAALYYGYSAMRMIGRVAFPIFCFQLVEGFQKTRDVKKYALRLGAFALISEVPFDLTFKAQLFDLSYQNVFFTLFFGLLTMIVVDKLTKTQLPKAGKIVLSGVAIVAGAVIAELLNTDYGAIGVVCIMALFVFKYSKVAQIVAGCIAFCWEITAPLAFIPIGFYNGERGLKLKYFFYAFYPLHLLAIYAVCWFMGIAGYTAL